MAAFATTGAASTSSYGVRIYLFTATSTSHPAGWDPWAYARPARRPPPAPVDDLLDQLARMLAKYLARRDEFRSFLGRPVPPPRARACRPRVLPPPADLTWRARALGRARN